MPELRTRNQQPSPVNPQVPVPNDFPAIPDEVLERFPSARDWQQRLNAFWTRTNQALQEAQNQTSREVNSRVVYTVDSFLIYARNGIAEPMFALDDTGIRLANVLVINTQGRKVYIGAGNYQNDDTPFYVDTLGRFSLGANLTWDPDTATLTITGIINATSGTIGGFTIGADFIRDTANSFGLASTVTGGDDVRFWAGDTFANRATAPLRIYESGFIYTQGIYLDGAAATQRYLRFQTAGVARWDILADADAESGANAGSPFVINRYADNGAYINSALIIFRDTGNWLLAPESEVIARINGIGVTSTIKFNIRSDTAATAGLNQWSPAIRLKGDGWHTVGAARLACQWKIEVQPATGGAAPYNPLVFSSDVSDSPTYVNRVTFDSTGVQAAIGATTPSTGAFTSLSATALAGAGTRTVVADAAGVLSAP